MVTVGQLSQYTEAVKWQQ